jgi:hypothetical protein
VAKGTDATWSPDGSWIAFRDRDSYYEMHPDGRGSCFITIGVTRCPPCTGRLTHGSLGIFANLVFFKGGLDAEVNQLRARRLEDGDYVVEILHSLPPFREAKDGAPFPKLWAMATVTARCGAHDEPHEPHTGGTDHLGGYGSGLRRRPLLDLRRRSLRPSKNRGAQPGRRPPAERSCLSCD